MTDVRLPGVQLKAIAAEDQELFLSKTRTQIADLIGPTYLLDRAYHFVDWNPAFDELFAKPLHLMRGTHVECFVKQLANVDGIVQRAVRTFATGRIPQTDTELLQLDSNEFGRVVFRKLAVQIPDDDGGVLGWSVHLVLFHADDSYALWAKVMHRLEREVTWSRYAVVYDQLLLQFPKYDELLDVVSSYAGPARLCIDLGAGTGNATIRLLDGHPDRVVYAVESNEIMLRLFRSKITSERSHRLHLVKDDIHNLSSFADGKFECATMVNVLYALDEPAAALKQVNRVLANDGVLIISTTHRDTDIQALLEELRQALVEQGSFDQVRDAFNAAHERHAAIDDAIHAHTVDDIRGLIVKAGFQIRTTSPVYSNKLVLFVASK